MPHQNLAVLTDSFGDIVYISGKTGRYLEPIKGAVNWNILVMARENMHLNHSDALRRANDSDVAIVSKPMLVETDGSLIQAEAVEYSHAQEQLKLCRELLPGVFTLDCNVLTRKRLLATVVLSAGSDVPLIELAKHSPTLFNSLVPSMRGRQLHRGDCVWWPRMIP
jgi:hypothetical protein